MPRSHLLYAVIGVLKGYDQLLNLVLDEATEYLRGGLVFVNLFKKIALLLMFPPL